MGNESGAPRARPPTKLNLGCGPVHASGWINVDGSHRARLASRLPVLDRLLVASRLFAPTEFSSRTCYARLEGRFPWPDDFADAIYMGELLEHFTRGQGEHVLKECYRVLKSGGVLRIRVPDNARFWGKYLAELAETKRRPRRDWTLDHTRWIEMFFREICVRPRPIGFMGHYHKWAYDEVSLVKTVEKVGFRDVERMAFLESRIPDIAAVELRDDLIVEGTKPSAG